MDFEDEKFENVLKLNIKNSIINNLDVDINMKDFKITLINPKKIVIKIFGEKINGNIDVLKMMPVDMFNTYIKFLLL